MRLPRRLRSSKARLRLSNRRTSPRSKRSPLSSTRTVFSRPMSKSLRLVLRRPRVLPMMELITVHRTRPFREDCNYSRRRPRKPTRTSARPTISSDKPMSRPVTSSARYRLSRATETSGKQSTRRWPRNTLPHRRSWTTSNKRLATSKFCVFGGQSFLWGSHDHKRCCSRHCCAFSEDYDGTTARSSSRMSLFNAVFY